MEDGPQAYQMDIMGYSHILVVAYYFIYKNLNYLFLCSTYSSAFAGLGVIVTMLPHKWQCDSSYNKKQLDIVVLLIIIPCHKYVDGLECILKNKIERNKNLVPAIIPKNLSSSAMALENCKGIAGNR